MLCFFRFLSNPEEFLQLSYRRPRTKASKMPAEEREEEEIRLREEMKQRQEVLFPYA